MPHSPKRKTGSSSSITSHSPVGVEIQTRFGEAGRVAVQEWLVTDQHGGFAMGTPQGFRLRKYHGFYSAIPGRSQSAFLADLEIQVGGKRVWPHLYLGPEGAVVDPELEQASAVFKQDPSPHWVWKVDEGQLTFIVQSDADQTHPHPKGGGIRLLWQWKPKKTSQAQPVQLAVRPFFAMRNLHGLGGQTWTWEKLNGQTARVRCSSESEVQCLLEGKWAWNDSPLWYENFYYPEEMQRGYAADENLYSAGELVTEMLGEGEWGWMIAEDPNDLHARSKSEKLHSFKPSQGTQPAALDFLLMRPAGIVAGYPWFGEWGRDTFVSLPGIVAAWARSGGKPGDILSWTKEVLNRWGGWITRTGMLPNLIEAEGVHQWESADATLWWCHSLASLWLMSFGEYDFLKELKEDFYGMLGDAISSIHHGRHVFLREDSDGLLEVTEPHTTWMDARVNGSSVTPRMGKLPEINALWFQAQYLHALWSPVSLTTQAQLENLGRAVLKCTEPHRPNGIFVHSLPIAPSFVLNDEDALRRDLETIAEHFWTPVGLRTLSPTHPDFHAHCVGTQEQRDQSYHQGSVWAWLGGHYEMALARLKTEANTLPHHASKMFSPQILADMPIRGHIAEIFDAVPPFTPRGAPAQAWSIACLEEAQARKKMRLDSKLAELIKKHWGSGSKNQKTAKATGKPSRKPRRGEMSEKSL